MSISSIDTTLDEMDDDTPIVNLDCNSAKNNVLSLNNIEGRLFKPPKIRKHGYWEIISLVAPRIEPGKRWNTSDATQAYCTKCKKKLDWSQLNPKAVKRHIASCHPEVFSEDAAAETKKIDNYMFKKMRTDLPEASQVDQLKGEVLIVKWLAESLRPFTLVDDPGFRNVCDFLCNLNKQFSVPGRLKVTTEIHHVSVSRQACFSQKKWASNRDL
jgi:hypothetical protein